VGRFPDGREVRVIEGEIKEFGHLGNATGAKMFEVKGG
jgi:hypothetical protein